MTEVIRVFSARKIITLNNYCPRATHVAVRGTRILGVGALEDLTGWGNYELDSRFADSVLMPGFVEGHGHTSEGQYWQHSYIGFYDRRDPDGRLWPGLKSIDACVDRLRLAEAELHESEQTLCAWGFDPIFFGDERMSVKHLDRVSAKRPVLVMHASGHIINVNSEILRRAGFDRTTNITGVNKDSHGEPTGELQELAPQYRAQRVAGDPLTSVMSKAVLQSFAQAAVNAGVTTSTDLYAEVDDTSIEHYHAATKAEDFPLRLVPAMNALSLSVEDGIRRLDEIKQLNHDKLHFGICKLMTDGSIQGFTGRLKWPGYYNGRPNGIWHTPPETFMDMVDKFHAAGVHLHIHTNGDEASHLALDAIENALANTPRSDHRHTLQHCQMADESQFRRMKALGTCVNLFANHLYYWGDQHVAHTMGLDRARRMDAVGTAVRLGVPVAIHSDVPVTPLAPLFTAWCAVNRRTASGKLLGADERVSVAEALAAITGGPAFSLRLDHLVGSIEPGKFADFAVLEDDPETVAPDALKDIAVWGTVLGGLAQRAASDT